jgi:hypothetical protein
VNEFLREEPGTGTGSLCSRYVYEVDRSPSGHTIELHRPAYLNKGIDFTVRCQSVVFNDGQTRWKHVPRHRDLTAALASLKALYPRKYRRVRDSLLAAYNCKRTLGLSEISDMYSAPIIDGGKGCPADVAILVAKWLFAEQDVTYWHNSGRGMLFTSLESAGLV